MNYWKEFVKNKFSRIFPYMVSAISPVLSNVSTNEFINQFGGVDRVVLNLGAGTTTYSNVISVDGSKYPTVDVVANLEDLPFKSGCADAVMSIGVLEHVSDPQKHIKEMKRVLKPGGVVFCFIPFIQPFHASPYDFQRYTKKGMSKLFSDFSIDYIKVGAGPTSSLVWVLQEWLALFLSFGNSRLYKLLVPLMWCLSPLKILDFFLVHHPNAEVVASGFLLQARKPKNP